jgi:replicative superfamily II helicase
LNSAIAGNYSERIKLVVVDEIHMIGEPQRGAVIESLIVKCLLIRPRLRIIGLTATVNLSDAHLLADWIDGFCFVSDVRPASVSQYVKTTDGELRIIRNGTVGGRIATLKSSVGDICHVMDPIRRGLFLGLNKTILIFVNTRAETVKTAEFISARLYDKSLDLPMVPAPDDHLIDARRHLIQGLVRAAGGVEEGVRRALLNGVGIHHAGLLLEERKLIEEAARAKTLSVLVATTTLSAGVNIHSVFRVLIMNIYRKNTEGTTRIPAAQFTQMVGRAGRVQGQFGEAIVFARLGTQSEVDEICKLATHDIPDIVPHLREPREMEKFYLQCLAVGLVSAQNGINEFLERTFRFRADAEVAAEATSHLVELGLIRKADHCATPLGRAIAGSSIGIEEGLVLARIIREMQYELCLDDEVHLLYLCVSGQTLATVKSQAYNTPMWERILREHRHVIRLVTRMDDRAIDRMQDLPNIYGGTGHVKKEIDDKFDRIYIAVILREFVNETPIPEITKKFKIERGTLQSLQMQCASFAGQITRFCELFGAGLLAATLTRFRQRLNFGARTELLGLIVLPSMSRDTARRLVDCGVASPIELADLSADAIALLIAPRGESGEILPAGDIEYSLAKRIHAEATEYTESLTRIEELEETAMQNLL